MRALCIEKPNHSHIIDIDEPGDLGPEDVLLTIRTVGICGTDLSTYRGVNPLVTYPRVPGHEIAATIEAKGANVPDDFSIGDTVTVYPYTNCGECPACKNNKHHACEHNATLGVQRTGAFTERFIQPWQKLIHANGLSFAETALIEPFAVGFHAVDRGLVTENDTVLVIGSGAIGLGCVAGAVARGARVICADLDNRKLKVAQALGAKEVIHVGESSLVDRARKLTDGHGVDVAIEAVGSPTTFTGAVDAVGYTGRVVYIGYSKEHVTYDTSLFVKKELTIRGSRNARRENFEEVIAALKSGNIPTDRVVSKTVSLEATPEAIDHWDKVGRDIVKIHVAINAE